jgi:hypothetical protein
VRHEKWGQGIIVAIVPASKPTATVDFGGQGEKKVLMSFLALST